MSNPIAAMPKYEAYKDSGVEWLEYIPEHWSLKKAKFMGEIYSGNSLNESQKNKFSSSDVTQRAYISSKDINADLSDINYENGLRIPKEEKELKVAPCHSILFCIEGGSAGKKIAYTHQEVCFVNKLACFTPHLGSNPKFLFYSLKAAPFQKQFLQSLNGLIGGVSISNIKNFFLTLPKLDEQASVVGFLDRKTAQIDQAVAIKEQQIELLKERKQILIQNAVTRGLNPDAPMRDSGVDWIGEIPAHWEVHRSKFVFGQRKEQAWKDDVQLSATQAYGVIPQELYEEKTGYRVVKIQFHLEKRKHVEVDDFVISMRSFQGGLERAWSRGCIRSSYVVLRPLMEVDTGYFSRLFKSPRYISALQATANFIRDGQDLNFENYSLVDLMVPPLSEQKEIAVYIETESTKIDRAIALQQQQIDKLKEYKATLINSAVTGKIRVS